MADETFAPEPDGSWSYTFTRTDVVGHYFISAYCGIDVTATTPVVKAVDVWYAMFAPASIPAEVLARLNGEIVKMLYTPDMKQRLATIGLEPAAEPVDKTAAYIKSEISKWGRVVTAAGITAE